MADGSQFLSGGRKIVGFAGGGGSSVAVRMALNCDPDMAMNHWLVAVLAHHRHFPNTDHHCADVFDVDPLSYRPGERISFGWFSPDCTDFSKAKGKAPRSARIRGLAWSVIPWAVTRRIEVIMLENVEEFLTWGPVWRAGQAGPAGEPIAERRGETFARWRSRLEHLGYQVDWRILNAADYGAPTTRKRLYVIARCDGQPIVWPERTHAPRHQAASLGLLPWVGACAVIDWGIKVPSIFLTPSEIKAQGLRVKRPLVAATQKRIARGLEKFVIGAAEPFIVPVTHQGDVRVHGSRDPLRTATAAHRGELAAVDVAMISNTYGSNTRGGRGEVREPTKTQTGNHHSAVVTGTLVGLAHGEFADRPGSRGRDVRDPINTVSAGGGDAALVSGYLVPRYGEREGQAPRALDIKAPYPVVVPDQNGGGLAAVYLGRQFGSTVSGRDAHEPTPTIMTDGGGGKLQAVAAHLGSYYGQHQASEAGEPTRSATGKDRHALTLAHMEQANTGMVGHHAKSPLSTIVGRGTTQRLVEYALELEGGASGRRAEVLAFLWTHFGEPTDADWADPAGTHAARLKFGLVLLDGAVWMIVDIGLRMLMPGELAAAMGLPADYDLSIDAQGRPVSKTNQIQMIGNMVSPPPAVALIRANCPHLIEPLLEQAA